MEQPIVCPRCGSEDLIEDDVLICTACGWKDENPEVEEEITD